MSPRTLTEQSVAGEQQHLAPGAPPSTPRPRLTVREMQVALDAARNQLSQTAPAATTTGKGDAVRNHPAPSHDASPANSTATAPTAASDQTDRAADTPPADLPAQGDPWLPEHDGPVSLTGVAAPRTRSSRRAVSAPPDKPARSAASSPRSARQLRTPALAPELITTIVASPPRMLVVPACGGAGATTTAVLLAAALAPVSGALLIAGGYDRGALARRSNAEGGDFEALGAWTREQPQQPLHVGVPGLAIGGSGSGQLLVAAEGRRPVKTSLADSSALTGSPAAELFAAAANTRAAVVLDWRTAAALPDRLLATTTHLVVVAPATAPGLLDAEYTVQQLEAARPTPTSLGLLTVDVRGRAPRRAGRAAASRLHALRVPLARLPYDPKLADDPRVHWPALRPRTRAAVTAAISQLLHREDAT